MLIRSVSQKLDANRVLQGFWHAVRHANSVSITRDPKFARVQPRDLEYFKSVLGDNGVITDDTALQALNE